MTHTYEISGMTCGSCVTRVKNELLRLSDVSSADIKLQSPQASIAMSRHIDTATLQEAISKAGNYQISESVDHTIHSPVTSIEATEDKPSYLPIFLIFGYITAISILVQVVKGSFNWMQWMSHFMSGFFFVFSFFKLVNLKGFAEGYSTYDIVAKRFPAWGYVYPFVELALGVAFLTGFQLLGTNIVTFIVMSVSSIGVVQSLVKKTPFQCACLGTVIKLPLSKVTLVEDMLMVLMSAIMIVTML